MLDFPKNGKVTVNNGNQTIRFGAFEADLPSGEVRKSGSRIKLQDQPFKVLQILLEHPRDLVTREELQSRIWPEDSFGDFDHAVNVAVGKLRAALGDSAENPSFIETVPRRGYRFVARLDEGPVDTHPQLPAINGVRPSRVVSVFNRTLLALLAVVISGILVGSGVFLGHRTTKWQPPDFQRLTVSRGTVYSARFAPDGHSVIYAASWDGGPTEIFSTDPKIPGARSLGLPATQLLAVSSSGEMAVLQPIDYRFLLTGRGTLGQVPLTGGSPRQLAENIDWADWSTDAATLAAVRNVNGKQRLEFPLGHVLYETTGWISHPRISPKGDQVAFLDHPIYPGDKGVVSIVDLEGHKRVVSAAWVSVEGLAWSADGTEIWFWAAQAGIERHIYAVDLSGHQRLIFRAPGGVTLQDIASDGRVLVTRDEQRDRMMALAPGNKKKEISWRDWSVPTDISGDGNTVLFDEQGVESGPTYTVASAPGSTSGRDTRLLPRRGSYDDRRSPRACLYAHCCRGLHWRTPRRIAWHVLGKLSGGRVANRALDLEWDYDGSKEPQEQGANPNHSETGHQTRGASRTPRKTENRADLSQRGWQCDRSRQHLGVFFASKNVGCAPRRSDAVS